MAPPPPATLPLQDRLMQLAQTLQFGWFVGHVVLLFTSFFYGLSYVTFKSSSGWAAFNYRTAFLAAAATYGIVFYKARRTRAKAAASGRPQPPQSVLALIGDENVQYLLMAVVWLYSRQIPLAMLPFAVYSIFHVATYSREKLLPVLQPSAQPKPGASPASAKTAQSSSAIGDTLHKFVKTYYDSSMMLVAYLETALWFRVLLSALTFSKGSWVLLIVYTAFFRSRYAQSNFVQTAIHDLSARTDSVAANPNVPPPVKQAWVTLKGVIRQATDATDMRRYAGAQPAKKAT